MTCIYCGRSETGHVRCPHNHYICDDCHGRGLFETILNLSLSAKGTDLLAVAEEIMGTVPLPMLGCEHAWIAAGAFLAALRNGGAVTVTNEQITEALNRTRKQAIGAYCGLTGVCGIAPAIGASFSVILGAACPKDRETAITMDIVSRVVAAIAAETGPCCCKNFLRTALILSCQLANEHLQTDLPPAGKIICTDSHRHPHGCRKNRCKYYPVSKQSQRGCASN